MKSVGKQLEEARLAKSWTPELAARETKIKVERLRDLELDDYSNFSSPAYARGFVRTYARALGIDEYKILRQLDNKLPEDDNASFANDSGLPYVPEPSQTMHVSSANRTGLYIVSGLGLAVVAVIALVLFEAYRIGELPRYFANGSAADNSTNAAPAVPPIVDAEAPAHAIPVDPNDTTHSPRALPVDLGTAAAAPATTNAAPAGTNGAPVVAAAVPATYQWRACHRGGCGHERSSIDLRRARDKCRDRRDQPGHGSVRRHDQRADSRAAGISHGCDHQCGARRSVDERRACGRRCPAAAET